jgi:hypothetical protein
MEHLCLTCALADWKKTVDGRRLHPDGSGRCRWEQPHIPTPAAWKWDFWRMGPQPRAHGGYIDRRPDIPIIGCDIYRKIGEGK